ncbi:MULTISPECIES: helix-turn-helix transcriptional regulator [Lysinibacillus]|uniref:helix-turn-helix transcriptional regulator n=1 Tax=Lysinibacillus TaxID=400634 RepID=UPI00214AC0BE|nr:MULTISPECIES: helix-turn-helix transcriptional regulator [Lysinibacillus]UUV23869.1 helix-turn-helix transcriptional regulator [Lysinibacillus sp. FN11]UYB46741.1 helix-turn-helix transcriptional regulator [Lysinibacillus capsici]WGT38278.1 helix-turn-helix transcriptional regulator [Lysinibacillus sp. 1 U-2021]
MKRFSLAALRVNRNMTQQDVADRLGVSRQTVAQWENNCNAKELVIYALAKLYDVELDEIQITA